MKKIISLLLCMLLATGLMTGVTAASTGYGVGTIQSVSLEASQSYINAVESTNADALSAARALLESAVTPVSKPDKLELVAAFSVQAGGQSHRFVLHRADGQYLLQSGNQYREVTYAAFNDMINAIGTRNVYKYYFWPQGVIRDEEGEHPFGGECGVVKGTYRYLRLSGKYNTHKVSPSEEVYEFTTTNGKLLLPEFDREPGDMTVTVGSWQGNAASAKAYTLPSKGSYTVRIRIVDDAVPYRYDMTYEYALEYTDQAASSATPTFSVKGENTHLGEAVVFQVKGGSGSPLATYTTDISFSIPPKFHRQSDNSQIMLFPVSYFNASGNHWVEVTCGGESARFVINAKDKQWQRQDLGVSNETTEQTINNQKANEEYERVIAPLRGVTGDKYWKGRFILPVSDQRVTTQFGMVRYVNGAPTSSRHGALDLAVPRGTSVKATNSGKVLYAGFLQLTGNTVLIEHGYGLKSWYYHMDSLAVNTDDFVEQGQTIGTVGSTGFSTGPHLHFGMSVNNIFINPYTAIQTDLFN